MKRIRSANSNGDLNSNNAVFDSCCHDEVRAIFQALEARAICFLNIDGDSDSYREYCARMVREVAENVAADASDQFGIEQMLIERLETFSLS
jgi:hypothetical protein